MYTSNETAPSHSKREDILRYMSEIIWVNLKGIVLSKTSQSQGHMLLGSTCMRSIKPSNSGQVEHGGYYRLEGK